MNPVMPQAEDDVYGRALYEYYSSGKAASLLLHTSYGEKEKMPVDWFFRDEEDFPPIEMSALAQCRGKVLDIGAGVGSHAVYLHEMGLEVETMDNSAYCVRIMQERGLSNVWYQSIWQKLEQQYDTLLLLMNGIGIVGKLEGLRKFLHSARDLLLPGGQILFDSSDLTYLYPEMDIHQHPYLGEITYQYEYRKKKGQPFQWLYIDPKNMEKYAHEAGWDMEILLHDHNDQYLARLSLRKE
jgi:hypothetical protein